MPKDRLTSSSLLENPCYKELLIPYFSSSSDYLTQWSSEVYPTNNSHVENLIYKTLAGHNVRSKSEVIIANTLYLNKVPYRYECELCLHSIKLYPDFTICHPETHEILYWEHFGMFDNASYRENAINKIKLYGNNNIYPTIKLITTYETQMNPIDSNQIQRIVEQYFV